MSNRGDTGKGGDQAAARFSKLRMERQPFLAPKTAFFGLDFTGPHILVVINAIPGLLGEGSK